MRLLLQIDIDRINSWFKLNKLTVNISKTSCILFSSNHIVTQCNLDLTIDGNGIEQVSTIRYLGLTLDCKLTWADHVSELCKVISPKVGLLRKLKHILPHTCLDTVYRTTVQSRIDYLLSVWGFTADCHLHKVQKMQNRAARLITHNFDRDVRSIDIVKQLGWQSVTERRDYFTIVTVFKSLNGLLPPYMQDMFTYSHNMVSRTTRSTARNDLYVPPVNRKLFCQSLQYTGAKLWNSLPINLRTIDSLPVFKHKLKQHLCNAEPITL